MEGGEKGKAWQTRVRNWKAQRLKQKNLGLIPSTSRWSLETKTAYWFYWMAKSPEERKTAAEEFSKFKDIVRSKDDLVKAAQKQVQSS